jgi:hypothetical protein
LPENPLNYYKDLPFFPGLDFYRALSETEFDLNHFGTFIPDTLINMGRLTWIQWVPGVDSYGGKNKRRDNDFMLANFTEHLSNLEASLYARNSTDLERPVVIEKKLASSYFNTTERTMSLPNLVNTLNTHISVNAIIQRFCYARVDKA